jgi:hypothetical protein
LTRHNAILPLSISHIPKPTRLSDLDHVSPTRLCGTPCLPTERVPIVPTSHLHESASPQTNKRDLQNLHPLLRSDRFMFTPPTSRAVLVSRPPLGPFSPLLLALAYAILFFMYPSVSTLHPPFSPFVTFASFRFTGPRVSLLYLARPRPSRPPRVFDWWRDGRFSCCHCIWGGSFLDPSLPRFVCSSSPLPHLVTSPSHLTISVFVSTALSFPSTFSLKTF